MSTDLAHHIQGTPLVDTHEHLDREHVWLENGPDILQTYLGITSPQTSTRRVQRPMRWNV